MNEALAAEVENSRFTPVRIREGYDIGEVDDFLDRLCVRLRRGEPVADLIAGARFTPVRIREGYDMGDVDKLLTRVTAESTEAPPGAGRAPAPTVADSRAVAPATDWVNPVGEVSSPLTRLFRRRKG